MILAVIAAGVPVTASTPPDTPPAPTEPAPTEPTTTQPPAPTDPTPTDPTPTDPTPTEPASTEPTSSEPTSSEPATSEPGDTAPSDSDGPPIVIFVAGTLGLTKEPSVPEAEPGQEFDYTFVASCSGLDEGCVDAVLTDTVPPELDIVDLPPPTSNYTVEFDEATRQLTVRFTFPLGAPNPPGSVGLPAGGSANVVLGVGIPSETELEDGDVITNTATLSAGESDPVTATANVDVAVPRVVTPVATKTWNGTAVAGTDTDSTMTLGIRNASSSSAEVTELTIEDATPAVFDRFDVTSIGPVTMPAGANQVVVQACTVTLSACADTDYVAGAPQSGPTLSLPPGVAAADVTGLRFVFTDAGGAVLPFDTTPGTVDVGLVLRDTLRSSGADYQPTTPDNVQNCNAPGATDTVAGTTAGTDACDTYTVYPAQATISTAKQFFADSDGNFAANGRAIVGLDSPVSAIVTATNTSPFPLATLTVTEPSSTSTSEYDHVDVTDVRVVFPAGATTAELTVVCGGTPITTTLSPPGPINQPTGCAQSPDSISVEFTGVDGDGNATIAEGASGSLGIHGTLNDLADDGDANAGQGAAGNGVTNCGDSAGTSSIGGVSAAAGNACSTLQLWTQFVTLSGTKTATLPTILPGLPRLFNLTFTNDGSIPATNVVLADPVDPTSPDNPFLTVRLAELNLPATPAATVELYDPDAGAYVPFDPASPDDALLARSIGFRVIVPEVQPQFLPGNQTYALSFNVFLRDGIEAGTAWRNCAGVSSDQTPAASNFCGPQMTVADHSSGAALQKSIDPATSVRPQAGLPGEVVQIKHIVQNTGTLWLSRLVVVDNDPAFYDAVDLTGSVRVNFPPGSDRVQVDVCTTGVCGDGDWVLGTVTGSQTPGLPAGVDPQTVTGVRVTFTAVPVPTPTVPAGDPFRIRPGTNLPTSGPCTNASVCIDFQPRIDLRSAPGTEVPDDLVNTATGGFESTAQGGELAPIPATSATHTLTAGTGALRVSKTPADTTLAPGAAVNFVLRAENTGTGPIPDPVIVEPIPEGLDFEPTDPEAPYEIFFQLPPGAPEPPEVVFTPSFDPATGRTTGLRWEFPGWDLLPDSFVSVSIRMVLAPGVVANDVIENRAGGSGAREDLTCDTTLVPRPGEATGDPYGDGLFCTSAAHVRVVEGNAFQATKWVAGNPDLGLLNTLTGEIVPVGDGGCPQLSVGGEAFTRYPCVARTLPGDNFDYYLQLTNAGTNPATEVRVVDVFPHPGDTGVILTGSPRGTAWAQRPTLASAVSMAGPGAADIGYSSASSGWCTGDLQSPPSPCDPSAYGDGAGASTQAFRAIITFPEGARLQPGQTTGLTFSMNTPVNAIDAENQVAWNSFAHTEFFASGSTISQLPPTEPIRVGVTTLYEPSVSVGDYVWFDADRDGVQNEPAENGINGVTLTLTGPDGNPVTDVFGNPVGPVQTADGPDGNPGSYRFINLPVLPAGEHYTVTVTPPDGYLPTQEVGDPADGDNSSTGTATSTDLVNDGDSDPTLDFGFIRPVVSVGDLVWVDVDRDGIQDPGEPGIEGVELTLTGPDGNPVTDVFGDPVGPATTDAAGNYIFENLPALPAGEHYTVTVTPPDGYLPTQEVGDPADGDNSSTGTATSADLVNDGDSDTTLDFGFVLPAVSVGDLVWFDQNRDGLQDADEPGIDGVELTLTGPDGGPVTDVYGDPVGPVTTDADGNYQFINLPVLPAGQHYTVTVTPPDGYQPTQVVGGPNDADNSSTGTATSTDLVNDGDNDPTLDFGFVVPAVSVGDLVWFDHDRDGLQDAGEPVIEGVELTLTGPDGGPVTDVFGDPVGPVATDADGTYVFENLPVLPAGEHYTVTVTPPDGYLPTQVVGDPADGDNSSTDTATSTDLVNDGDSDTTLDFGFIRPSVSVGDLVWIDVDRDGRQDAGEPGIEGVELTLTGPDGNPVTDVFGDPVGPVTTDANGNYRFDNLPVLPAGQHYTVTVTPPDGYQPTQVVGGPNDGNNSSTGTATSTDLVNDGDSDTTLDFGFVLPCVEVSGVVWFDSDGDGTPDADEARGGGYTVTINGLDGLPILDALGNPVGPVVTDANGNYRFECLPPLGPGEFYTLTFTDPDGTVVGIITIDDGLLADGDTAVASLPLVDPDVPNPTVPPTLPATS